VTDTLGGIGSQRPDGARWLARRTRAVFAPYPKALLGDVEVPAASGRPCDVPQHPVDPP